jgi:DNA-binding transcriptional MerR regulator
LTRTSNFYSIGKLVRRLKPEFSDISISKVRYLENEGLIKPHRTDSGYRQFTDQHIDRLRVILRLQKEFYLPLSEIKKRVDALDRGEQVDELKSFGYKNDVSLMPDNSKIPLKDATAKTRLSKRELDKLNEYHLLDLSKNGSSETIDALDLEVIEIAKALSSYGIEPRHLSMFESLAEREAVLFYQITAPLAKRDFKKAEKQINELVKYSQQLKSILLKKAILKQFSK